MSNLLKNLLPVPELESCKKLLCIQPHPDDNEVGAGATIAKLVKNGCSITYLTVTDGRIGTMNPEDDPFEVLKTRRNEIRDAAEILGISATLSFDYGDASYIDEKELTSRIVSVIREIQPEIVMTVDPYLPYEAHPDHRKVGMAVAEACLFSAFPHFYSFNEKKTTKVWDVKGIAFYNTAYPNTFINADDTWELKIKSIAAHKSQFGGEYFEMLKMYFDLKSRQLAEGKGFTHAEAFKVLTTSHLHSNVDSIYC